MKLDMVGRMPSHVLGIQADLIQKLAGNDGNLWLERTKRMLKGENPFAELVGQSDITSAWKAELVSMARRKLRKFSREWAEQVTAVPDVWNPDFLANAARYNMRPVFFPRVDINEPFKKKGFIKLDNGFYAHVLCGTIKGGGPTQLREGWCLADYSVGVDYANGTQVFPDDPWFELITELRTCELIGKDDTIPSGSRFAITWDEWDKTLLTYMASKLSTTRAQTTLERAIEFNFISNVYDSNRGRFNMCQWFADAISDSRRLFGKYRADGRFMSVDNRWCGHCDDGITSRPLVRFAQ